MTLHTDGITALCHNSKYPDFIDHIVTNVPASQMVVADSFDQLLYSRDDMSQNGKALPDHCPISLEVKV
jgi:NADPH-dependent 7-cyano-7-deazaguanine reductase QueF